MQDYQSLDHAPKTGLWFGATWEAWKEDHAVHLENDQERDPLIEQRWLLLLPPQSYLVQGGSAFLHKVFLLAQHLAFYLNLEF